MGALRRAIFENFSHREHALGPATRTITAVTLGKHFSVAKRTLEIPVLPRAFAKRAGET
jgi:hypothetical protein